MGARFGRNKRRAAREALALANSQLADATRQASVAEQRQRYAQDHERSLQTRLWDLEHVFAAVASMVCRESVLAGEPVHIFGGNTWNRKHGDAVTIAPIQPLTMADFHAMTCSDRMTIQEEVLRLLDTKVVRDRFNGTLHAMVEIAGEQAAYGITENALRRMNEQELERVMYKPIVQHLARQLKKVYK